MTWTLPIEIKTRKARLREELVVYYPQVVGLADHAWQKTVNTMIARQAQELVDEQTGGDFSSISYMLGYYEVKNNQRNILSLTQINEIYREHAAHGMRVVRSLTFDTKKKRVYSLSQLFKPGSAYVERLSALVAEQIKQRDIGLLAPFEGISPEQSFYIADKSLVLYFQLYELTPYAFGFPFFPISVYELADIIDEDGPLGIMAVNQ